MALTASLCDSEFAMGLYQLPIRQRCVVFTDIDKTLQLAGYESAMMRLFRRCEEKKIPIVGVTGNTCAAMKKRIDEGQLPPIAGIIGEVGTNVWWRHPDGSYLKDDGYKAHLDESGYDRAEIVQRFRDMIGTVPPDYRLGFQDPEKEEKLLIEADPTYQPYKVSGWFFGPDRICSFMRERVEMHFPDQKLVFCEEINHNDKLLPGSTVKKWNIDILPVTKGDTVNYFCTLFSIKKGLVCGDSGNDIDMLLNIPLTAVAVGGSKPELVDALKKVVTPESEHDGRRSG